MVDTTTSTLLVETQLSVIKSTLTFQPLTVHKVIIWIQLVSDYITYYPVQLKRKFALAMKPLSTLTCQPLMNITTLSGFNWLMLG